MEKDYLEEIYRADPELFAAPKCYVREKKPSELGISQEAKEALLEEYTIPDFSALKEENM